MKHFTLRQLVVLQGIFCIMIEMSDEIRTPFEIASFYIRLHHGDKLWNAGLYETCCFVKSDENSYYFTTDIGIKWIKIL